MQTERMARGEHAAPRLVPAQSAQGPSLVAWFFRRSWQMAAAPRPRASALRAPWTGRRGRIDSAWVAGHIADPGLTVFYACGPTTLVEFAEKLVLGLGVPKTHMKTEKWG